MSEAFVLSSEFEPAAVDPTGDPAGVRPLAVAGPGDRGVIVKVTGVSGSAATRSLSVSTIPAWPCVGVKPAPFR